MEAKRTHELDRRHVPMLFHPDVAVDVIRTAATEVQESHTTA
jgi:hypothetical protein